MTEQFELDIRIAEWDDLQQIVDIYNQAIAAGQKTADISPVSVEQKMDWFASHSPRKYPIFVAEDEGLIAGYLAISPYRPGRMGLRYTAEVSYFVRLEHHRKGIASNLMQAALDICSQIEIKTLFAVLIETNLASIALLEKFGFEKWGNLPRVVDFEGSEVGQLYYGLRVQE